MAALVNIQVTADTEVAQTISNLLVNAAGSRETATRISEYFAALAAGTRNGSIDVTVESVSTAATETLTIADWSTITAAEVLTIGEHVLVEDTDFTAVTSNAVTAAAIAAAITAHASLSRMVTAEVSGDTVVVTSKVRGFGGNGLLASTDMTGASWGDTELGGGGGTDTTARTTFSRGK